MEFLSHIGLFALEAITIVIALLLLAAGLVSIGRKEKTHLDITSLNQHATDTHHQMQKAILGKVKKIKTDKKQKKSTTYVIDFHGDIKASQVDQLREEISAILSIAQKNDEVIIRLESPGGSVNGYGLAASQLQRLRDHHLQLTVCIDKVAASGGYLMACVAHQIIAAPFAIIGSIGVVAQLPNFHRWLQKHAIDMELLTAGEYKRTLTLFGENTTKGRQKFQADLEEIHANFRRYVAQNRQQLDMDRVATGEHWLAHDARELGLVDILQTSDDYINRQISSKNVFKIKIQAKQTLLTKLLNPVTRLLHPFA